MGWTYSHRGRHMSDLEWFRQQFGTHPDGGERVLAAATVGLRTVYMAFRTQDNKVVGGVILIHWVPNNYYNFGYKDMCETSGPCESECPKRILDMLSPLEEIVEPGTDNYNWASEWRQRCQENLAKREKAHIKIGDILTFRVPIPFTDGSKLDRVVVISAKPVRFIPARSYNGSLSWPMYCYKLTRDALVRNLETVARGQEALDNLLAENQARCLKILE